MISDPVAVRSKDEVGGVIVPADVEDRIALDRRQCVQGPVSPGVLLDEYLVQYQR